MNGCFKLLCGQRTRALAPALGPERKNASMAPAGGGISKNPADYRYDHCMLPTYIL